MKLEELIQKFPWANHPFIRIFAEDFSESHWQMFADAGLNTLIENDALYDGFILEHLKYCKLRRSMMEVESIKKSLDSYVTRSKNEIKNKRVPFCSAVTYLLKMGFNKDDLDYFCSKSKEAIGFKLIFLTAEAHSISNKPAKEKADLLSREWLNTLYLQRMLCEKDNPTPTDIFESIKRLTFANYLRKSIEGIPILFPKLPSLKDLKNFKDEVAVIESFYNASMLFLTASSDLVNTDTLEKTPLHKSSLFSNRTSELNDVWFIRDLYIEFSKDTQGILMTITFYEKNIMSLYVSKSDKKVILACEGFPELLRIFPFKNGSVYNEIMEYALSPTLDYRL